MLLQEFFYFNKDGKNFEDDKRYDAERDISVVHADDTRKTRLTLSQINTIRRTAEARELEQVKELDFIRSMYGQPAPEAAIA
jgi:acetyl-CoA carboxylase alpha subunit